MEETRTSVRTQAATETICSILREHFAEKVGALSLSRDTRLRDEINLDSLDLLTLAAEVENRYGCPVLDEHTRPEVFSTIGSFSRHLGSVNQELREP